MKTGFKMFVSINRCVGTNRRLTSQTKFGPEFAVVHAPPSAGSTRIVAFLLCSIAFYAIGESPVRAEMRTPPDKTSTVTTPSADLNSAQFAATEFNKLVTLLGDGLLRDLVCRLAFERYTPRSLSMALKVPEADILKRVATLQGWGLVRTTISPSAETVIDAVPGEGQETMTRWGDRYCQQANSCRMNEHFSEVATHYNDLRTTDFAPIQFIQDALSGPRSLNGADIGCGPGRYSLLLLQRVPSLKLTCADVNPEMLREAERYLKSQGQSEFSIKQVDAARMPFADGSLDCMFSFNAFHHFDPEKFFSGASDALRDDGLLFIYTRLESQNAQSIWGQHFPNFTEKEGRLTNLREIERWSHCIGGLRLETVRFFEYDRVESLSALLRQARNQHYSTFRYYSPSEFEAALATFEQRIRNEFPDPDHVKWVDRNVMLVFRSKDARHISAAK